ncbi:hypothetical protein GBAR_LOCUS6616 [Geodia barretti]|uniref:Uncharacterized protein n=1 Tax=Geodia barretti TaxID=519541 RepID=A0AA35RFY0_GEOBA|nr:hypothetical protein GBAR_LOCUS6616 [Geodia barretti]
MMRLSRQKTEKNC